MGILAKYVNKNSKESRGIMNQILIKKVQRIGRRNEAIIHRRLVKLMFVWYMYTIKNILKRETQSTIVGRYLFKFALPFLMALAFPESNLENDWSLSILFLMALLFRPTLC